MKALFNNVHLDAEMFKNTVHSIALTGNLRSIHSSYPRIAETLILTKYSRFEMSKNTVRSIALTGNLRAIHSSYPRVAETLILTKDNRTEMFKNTAQFIHSITGRLSSTYPTFHPGIRETLLLTQT